MEFGDRFTDHLVITPELLVLMRRLVTDHEHDLKALVSKVVTKKSSGDDVADPQEAQAIILEFFALMEHLLEQAHQEQEVAQHLQKQLMPSLNHIDQTSCDHHMVSSSAQSAIDQMRSNAQANPQELLFKEILKHWKPSKKTILH